MPFIPNLNSSAPADEDSAGGAAAELRALKQTLQDQFPSIGAAPVTLSATQVNALDVNLAALAAEVGFNFASPGDATRIDTIEAAAARNADNEVVTGIWSFTSATPIAFTVTPTFAGATAAKVTDIPSKRVSNRVLLVNQTGNYQLVDDDFAFQRKVRYTGTGDATFTVPAGQDGDITFISNASTAVLTVVGSGMTFRTRYGENVSSFTITGRWRTVGLHQVSGTSFDLSGDYD